MTITAVPPTPEPHEVAPWCPLTLADQDGAGEPHVPAEAVCGGIWTEGWMQR